MTEAERAVGEAACAFLDDEDPALQEACVVDVVCGQIAEAAAWHENLGDVEVFEVEEGGVADPCHTSADALTPDVDGNATLECPDCSGTAYCYGTDVYTSDSSVCSAAAHAGVIDLSVGGSVTIHFLPGEDAYEASARNGVECAAWGSWNASFEVLP